MGVLSLRGGRRTLGNHPIEVRSSPMFQLEDLSGIIDEHV